MNRPLSHNYEWVTTHTLITLDVWNERGSSRYGFNPVYTYDNPNDRHIQSLTSGIADKNGNYYYVSYPPFTFLFPYLIFRTLSIEPSAAALQGLNLMLHLISTCFLYLLIRTARGQRSPVPTLDIAALAGCSIYLFAAPNLWYHANVIFADVLVQPFFITAIWLTLRYVTQPGDHSRRRTLAGLGAAAFMMTYTEWLGVFFTASLTIYTLAMKRAGSRPVTVLQVRDSTRGSG